MMPPGGQEDSAAKVEPVIRQIVDRALKDYPEDAEAPGEGRMQVPEADSLIHKRRLTL